MHKNNDVIYAKISDLHKFRFWNAVIYIYIFFLFVIKRLKRTFFDRVVVNWAHRSLIAPQTARVLYCMKKKNEKVFVVIYLRAHDRGKQAGTPPKR